MEELVSFTQALLAADRIQAAAIFQTAREQYTSAQLMDQLIAPALEQIGDGWDQGEVALSQVYMSGRICEELINTIPHNSSSELINPLRVAVAVLDDYHFLGKRMVYSVLRAGGYPVHDYDRVTVDELVQRAGQDNLDVLCISTLMLPSALRISQVTRQLAGSVKVVVGGAPFRFDPQLWQEVGAHAMGATASDAPRLIAALTRGAE